jgi:hypothetical protein
MLVFLIFLTIVRQWFSLSIISRLTRMIGGLCSASSRGRYACNGHGYRCVVLLGASSFKLQF